MPIRFRCQDCKKLLGIARRKAGTEIICPHCAAFLIVPTEDDLNEQADLDEIDELLSDNPSSRPTSPKDFQRAQPVEPQSLARNVELAQGLYHPAPIHLNPPHPPAPQRMGIHPSNLVKNDAFIVLNAKKTTILVVFVAVIVFAAFVAGFLAGSR